MDTPYTASRCPLCGGDNSCGLIAWSGSSESCWCESVAFPDELAARIPEAAQGLACVCRACIDRFSDDQAAGGLGRSGTRTRGDA